MDWFLAAYLALIIGAIFLIYISFKILFDNYQDYKEFMAWQKLRAQLGAMEKDILILPKNTGVRVMVKVRPEIMNFARNMETTMQRHDKAKGNSWQTISLPYLYQLATDEIKELQNTRLSSPEYLGELLDTANFCMMLYNRLNDPAIRARMAAIEANEYNDNMAIAICLLITDVPKQCPDDAPVIEKIKYACRATATIISGRGTGESVAPMGNGPVGAAPDNIIGGDPENK